MNRYGYILTGTATELPSGSNAPATGALSLLARKVFPSEGEFETVRTK